MKDSIILKDVVIYHSADFDGIFCREIARKFLPPDTEFIGWNFGDPTLPFPDKDTLYYVLDLPMNAPFGLKFEDGWLARDNFIQTKEERQIQPIDRIDFAKQWVWIDHHATSIASHPTNIPGYRIDGVAACRLAWQWFTGFVNKFGNDTPQKADYVERRVTEPMAVRLTGEYDIWDKRDPNAELFQHGLRAQELTAELWNELLGGKSPSGAPAVMKLLERGAALQYAKTQENAGIITTAGFDLDFEGLHFLACNAARYNSHLFTAGLTPKHDALLGFAWRKDQWTISLYHAPGKEHHDLSLIAKKHNGGGHKGACGFICTELPFTLGTINRP